LENRSFYQDRRKGDGVESEVADSNINAAIVGINT
jgi:hypothetical protein